MPLLEYILIIDFNCLVIQLSNNQRNLKMTNEHINERKAIVSQQVKPRKHGVKAYVDNPFWKPYEVKVGTKKVTISGGYVANSDNGESIHHAGIHRVEKVDEDKFIKLFTQNLKIFFDLSPSSQKVLRYMLETLQKTINADGIWLPWFDVEEYSTTNNLKISRTSYHRALKEMLEKGFIAESERPNFYWINPNLFFNGDRMTFISTYIKKKPGITNQKNNDLSQSDDMQNRLIED